MGIRLLSDGRLDGYHVFCRKTFIINIYIIYIIRDFVSLVFCWDDVSSISKFCLVANIQFTHAIYRAMSLSSSSAAVRLRVLHQAFDSIELPTSLYHRPKTKIQVSRNTHIVFRKTHGSRHNLRT